jgi:putative ABC transport system permease protein
MNVLTRGARNAFRNGIRTLSIVLILGLSIGLALTMLIANKAVEGRIDSVKASIGNTITVSPAGSRGFEGGGEPLTADQLAKLKQISNVSTVTATLRDRLETGSTSLVSAITPGTLGQRNNQGAAPQGGPGGGNFTPPITVTGTDELSAAALGTGGGSLNMTAGDKFDPTKDAAVAVVGKDLADKNGLAVGSNFQAHGTTVTVAGIFDAGNTFSNNAVLMPLVTVQRLSGQAGNVTGATVQVNSLENVGSVAADIKNSLGSAVDVTSEQERSGRVLEPLQNINSISTVSLIGAVLAGAVITLLAMIMIVRERRREIGVLKAIGASNVKVITQFATEALTFTGLALVVGLGVGAIGANPITQLLVKNSEGSGPGGPGGPGGGAFRAIPGAFGGLRDITASVGWDILIYAVIVAFLIAILGSAVPAWLISKVRPAEVMRAE